MIHFILLVENNTRNLISLTNLNIAVWFSLWKKVSLVQLKYWRKTVKKVWLVVKFLWSKLLFEAAGQWRIPARHSGTKYYVKNYHFKNTWWPLVSTFHLSTQFRELTKVVWSTSVINNGCIDTFMILLNIGNQLNISSIDLQQVIGTMNCYTFLKVLYWSLTLIWRFLVLSRLVFQ